MGRRLSLAAGLGLVLAVMVALPARVAAQAALRLDALRVELWPEYDQPAVLVLLDGRLAAGTPLPVTLALPIPAAAGQPHAVAVYDANGDLLEAEFTTTTAGDDIIVTFSTDALAFRLEYYDPALTVAGTQRTYTLNWASPYAVALAAVRVQQPAGSSDLAITPALTAERPSADGLHYKAGSLGTLAAGQAVQVTLTYTKPDARLTTELIDPGAALPADGAANPVLGGLAAAVGLVIAGGAIYGYPRRPKPAARVAAQRRRRTPAAAPITSGGTGRVLHAVRGAPPNRRPVLPAVRRGLSS